MAFKLGQNKAYLKAALDSLLGTLNGTGFKNGIIQQTAAGVFSALTKSTAISSSSTDSEIPTAKAVKDAVDAATPAWGNITGELEDQTDLNTVLNSQSAQITNLNNKNKLGILSCNPTYYSTPIVFNSTAHTCRVNPGNIIADSNIVGVFTTETVLTLSAQNGIILANPDTGAITVVDRTSNISSKLIVLAVYSNYGAQVSCPTYFTIDGYPYGVKFKDIHFGILSCNPTYYPVPVAFNSSAHTCVLGGGNIVANGNIDAIFAAGATLNLTYQNGIILINATTGIATVVNRTSNIAEGNIVIAVYSNYGAQVSCPTYFTIDGYPYGINITPTITKYPNYEYTTLQNATWWSDFCFINDELWVFTPSGDETHTLANGYIKIYNPSTGALNKTYIHDFGHCNTVHYNATTDKLLIGNLPGNTTYPSAVYIFDDVSTWTSKASGSTLNFSTESPKIIDFSALGSGATQTVACWGENNMSQNNIMYLSGNYNTDWYKILLGMGSDNLGSGTFVSTDADKFNGSYKVIWHKTFTLKYDGSQEVIQGIDYNGNVWTSNGHNELQWWKWGFSSDGMCREENATIPYNADGTINYCVSEGFCIKDGYAYVGCIFTNSAHSTATGTCGIIKTKIST